MFLFNSFFSSKPAAVDNNSEGETVPAKMNLEERMSFRREMLFDTIGYTMQHKGIPADAYRLRISRTDKRGHQFVVMLDLSSEFLHSAYGTQTVLSEIGRDIADHAKASGFLEVVGVYWRVCDELTFVAAVHSEVPKNLPHDVVPQLRARAGCDARIYASDMAPLSQ